MAWALSIVLAIATGAVLDATRIVALDPAVAVGADPRERATEAVVRRFYAAVDGALATGDAVPLGEVIGEDFVDHAPRPGTSPDRTGFVRALRSLHDIAPELRLGILDLVAQGDRMAVRVGVAGADGASFLGISVPAASVWGATEVVRVEAGQIVERWGDATGLGFFDPLLAVPVPIEAPAGKALTLERWTYDPGAGETRGTDLGCFVLLVETGELTAEVTPGANAAQPAAGGKQGTAGGGRSPAPGEAGVLGPGASLVVPQGSRIVVRNDGDVPAVALAVVAAVPAAAEMSEWAGQAPRGVTRTMLAGGSVATLPAGEAAVAIGRAVLAPGTGFAPHAVHTAELAGVEDGTLALSVAGGGAWVASLPGGGQLGADAAPIGAGGGVRIEAGTTAGYLAMGDRPLRILLVTIEPAETR